MRSVLGRAITGLCAVAVVVLSVLVFASRPEPGSEPAGLSALFLEGDEGAALLPGEAVWWSGAGYEFSAQILTGKPRIVVAVHPTPATGDWWSITIGSPTTDPLVPGLYEGVGSINASRAGTVCSDRPSGTFEILELERDATTVHRFAASFEVHCRTRQVKGPAMYGEVRFNSTIPVAATTLGPMPGSFIAGETKTITLANHGSVASTPVIQLEGINAAQFSLDASDCDAVGAGATCQLDVTFAGTRAGTSSARLVAYDDTRRGAHSVQLVGNGRPSLSVSLSATPSAPTVASGVHLVAYAPVATGSVTFLTGTAELASAPVGSDGVAETTVQLGPGSHWIVARYVGADHAVSESPPLLVTVAP